MKTERKDEETELLHVVIRLCDGMGLWWWHDYSFKINRRGLPDLLVLGKQGAMWRELKSQDGRHSLDQLRVQRLIVRAGWDYDTWRPGDLISGRIAAELAAIM